MECDYVLYNHYKTPNCHFVTQEKFEEVFGTTLGVPTANATRWNSVLRQIQSILKRGFVQLNNVSRATDNKNLVFSAKEWEQLNELVEVLEPFKVYTDLLQGEEVRMRSNIDELLVWIVIT